MASQNCGLALIPGLYTKPETFFLFPHGRDVGLVLLTATISYDPYLSCTYRFLFWKRCRSWLH